MSTTVLFSELTPEILHRFPEAGAKISRLVEPLAPGKGMMTKNDAGEMGIIYGVDSKYPYKSVIEMLDKCQDKGLRNLSIARDRPLNKAALQAVLNIYNLRYDLFVTIID